MGDTLRRLFRLRRDVRADVDDELAFHLEMRTRENLAGGMAPAAARAAAERRFGALDSIREACVTIDERITRKAGRADVLAAAAQDLRFAARTLRRAPGFAAVVVVTLALGLGANTAIFSVVNAILLRPLPYVRADELVELWEPGRTEADQRVPVSPPTFLDVRARSHTLTAVAAVSRASATLTRLGEPRQVDVASVSAGVFPLLGAHAALGRTLLDRDDAIGADPVVVLSHAFWAEQLGGDRGVIGRTLTLDGVPHEIVGVMPAGFVFPAGVRLWTPLLPALGADALTIRGARILDVIGRRRRGVSLGAVRAELAEIARRIADADPTAAEYTITVAPLKEEMVGAIRPRLLALLGAVGFVLLIACANVANLLLARGAARRRELTIRAALGAGRWRIARQLLTETTALALAGGSVGVLLAHWAVPLLLRLVPAELPRAGEVRVDAGVLAFAVGLSLACGLLVGVAPALRGARGDLIASLGDAGRSVTAGGQRRRARGVLVGAEVALTVVLLTGAGLLIRSFARLMAVDPGFRPERVTSVRILLSPSRYPQPAQQAALLEELIRRLARVPGVRALGGSTNLPMSGSTMMSPASVAGRPAPRQPGPPVQVAWITPGYPEAMGIALVRGRPFAWTDRPGAPAVALVDESFARRFFPAENPVGRRVRVLFGGHEWREIVGVVRAVRHAGLAVAPRPQLYIPYLQDPRPGLTVVLRSDAGPAVVARAARAELRALDPDQPVERVAAMEQLVAATVAQPRFYLVLLGAMAALALLLAAVGVYATAAYAVAQRTHEIGIRMAVGATASSVLRLVLRQGLAPTVAGLALGLVGALIATRLLGAVLYEVTPLDPVAYVGGAAVLLAVAGMAMLVPARRAARIDPMVALRDE